MGVRKVVDFLVPLKLRVDLGFDAACVPHYCGHFTELVEGNGARFEHWSRRISPLDFLLRGELSKPIVFEGIADNLDIAIAHVEIVPPVRR